MKETKKSIAPFLALIVFLVLVDQIVKIYIKLNFFPGEIEPVFDWFYITYTENAGMAFGIEPFGANKWGKILVTLLRFGLIIFIGRYLWQLVLKQARWSLITAFILITAGALGNIIDNAFYDFIFPASPFFEERARGFLLASVVDMFQFNVFFPQWMPYIGGMDVFPAIFNVADAYISMGIGIILLFERSLFEDEKQDKNKKNIKNQNLCASES